MKLHESGLSELITCRVLVMEFPGAIFVSLNKGALKPLQSDELQVIV